MNTFTKIATGLSAAFVLLASSSASAGDFSSQKFVDRIGDMARAAKASYGNGSVGNINIKSIQGDDISHSNVDAWSSDVVQVYKHVFGDGSVSFVVSFRGTQASVSTPLVATGDLLRDLQGATVRKRPENPWLAEQEPANTDTFVGRGFHRRVTYYMENEGTGLRDRLLALKGEVEGTTKQVEVHVTGHSLGAISSQIFSFYLSQFMRENEFPADKFKINNFGFNTPRGAGPEFANAFQAEVRRPHDTQDPLPHLTAYNLTVERDPVSEWTLAWLHGAIYRPNSVDTDDYGYCPHAQVESVDTGIWPSQKLNNHWLDDDALFKWGALGQYESRNPALPQCMADGYHSMF